MFIPYEEFNPLIIMSEKVTKEKVLETLGMHIKDIIGDMDFQE